MPISLLLQTAAPPATTDDVARWLPLLVGGGVLAYLYVRSSAKRRRTQDPMERPAATASLSQQRNVEREMQHLLVELSQMARQLTAQLDTRSAKLELLIKEADDRLEQLKAATGQLGPAAHENFRIGPAAAEPAPPAVARHAEIYALQDAGRTPYQIAEHLGRPAGEIELILALRPR